MSIIEIIFMFNFTNWLGFKKPTASTTVATWRSVGWNVSSG